MAKPPNNALRSAEARILCDSLLETELVETQEVPSSNIPCELRTVMPQLYDMESSYSEPEKSLPLDLGLDQIEDCQE